MSSTEEVKAPTDAHSLAEGNGKSSVQTRKAEATEVVPIDPHSTSTNGIITLMPKAIVIESDCDEDEDKSIANETFLSEKDIEDCQGSNYADVSSKESPDIFEAICIEVTGAGTHEANGIYEQFGIRNGFPVFTLPVFTLEADNEELSNFELFYDKDEGRWLITGPDGIACYECIDQYGYLLCVNEDEHTFMKKTKSAFAADPLTSRWETCGAGTEPAPKLGVIDSGDVSLALAVALGLGLIEIVNP